MARDGGRACCQVYTVYLCRDRGRACRQVFCAGMGKDVTLYGYIGSGKTISLKAKAKTHAKPNPMPNQY